MKKNDIFTFVAPNGVEITAVAIYFYDGKFVDSYIGCTNCIGYAQNRLFTCKITFKRKYFAGQVPEGEDNPVVIDRITNVETIVDYCILPDYDELLARYNDLQVAQAETNIGM